MATAVTESQLESEQTTEKYVVNEMSVKIATVNGSGSQSANMILVRAMFTMGIPVCGKNLFPSNIQGLPTWYVLRASERGWLGFKRSVDVMVAMNPATVVEDVASLEPGALLLVDSSFKGLIKRDDITVYAAPFGDLVKEVCEDTRRRKMVINILYVGILASVLGIEPDEMNNAIDWQFAKKPKAAQLNKDAAMHGYTWAQENLPKQDRYRLRRANKNEGKILIEGNECVALGLMFGGLTVASWYPITPSSSVCEALTTYLEKHRRDSETGKNSYAVIQAEDELAAIGMVLGAGWAGARAATATSGPGMSLMAEMAGLSYFAEIPAVVINVQRMGPSTGLPTRNSQGDLLSAYLLSHGDCKHVMLIPGTMKECYEFAMDALDYAEELQTLVFLMSDLDLGMNRWVTDQLQYPEKPIKRGKVLSAEQLEEHKNFARYRDVDGDGICYRTLPGTDHPNAAYFTRGTGHTEDGTYSEKPDNWKRLMARLSRKFETARKMLPPPVLEHQGKDAEIGVLAFGSSNLAVQEAISILEDRDVPVDYLRVRALPPHEDLREFIAAHRVVYVVEQNRDGQMACILYMEFPELAYKVKKIVHMDGTPIDALSVVNSLLELESKKA